MQLWFGGDLNENYEKWFTTGEAQKVLDLFIAEKYTELLKKAEAESLAHWKNHPESYVALIVLLDQFSRHIYRNSNREQIKVNDEVALRYSKEFISRNWHKSVSLAKHVFVLMPFRHCAHDVDNNLKYVLQQLEEREKMTTDDVRLLDRFKKMTQRKLYDAPLRKKVDQNTEILEFYPFDADESDILQNKLVRTMHDFLQDRYEPEHKYTIISLSGGVDSMCILKCLLLLAPKFKYKVIAIHIDYANRPESGLEATYVEEWCKKFDVIFRKRVISEVTRGITDRELYEKESRRIRFEFYRSVLNEFQTDSGICLGHHKGDEQENIITNIMKGRESILNLSGMSPESIIEGVKVWRPCMPHPKSVIYDFSHKYGIPYFLDTTPVWSNRGKVRNHLQPLLGDIFGFGYLNNLSALGEDSKELSELLTATVFKPVWETIKRTEVGVWFNIKDHRTKPKLFWKETMRYIFYSMGVSTVRDKSMGHFMKRMGEGFAKEGVWVSLKLENPALFFEDSLIIFRSSFFPSTSYFTNKSTIEVSPTDPQTVVTFGPWTVTLTPVPVSEFHQNELSIWDVLSGSVSYYIRNSTAYQIDSNSKPKPFRAIPKNMTLFMPIVINSTWNVEDEKCIKVTLNYSANELQEELRRLEKREQEKQMCKPIKKYKGIKDNKVERKKETKEEKQEQPDEEILMDFN
uniref:tRNA(Ile)-lysidine synthetase n=1 Tax=Arcella intermedia TaxID=1963864 RepID=A0A6B2KYV1_9EUKA